MTTPTHHHQPPRPRNAEELLAAAVIGLQQMSLAAAMQRTRTLNIEPPHAPLLRAAAAESSPFRVRRDHTTNGRAA